MKKFTGVAYGRFSIALCAILLPIALLVVWFGQLFVAPVAHGATCGASTNFITTWKTDNPGSSNSTSITLTADPVSFNYNIDWDNDGVMDETLASPNTSVTHDFGTPGTYTIQICGSYPYINWDYSDDQEKLIRVNQWGDNAWTTMADAFYGASNMTITATDTPDLSSVTNASNMFRNASSFNQDISGWDVSNIQNFTNMFSGASSFNQDISGWEVGGATNMAAMFAGASSFNQDIGEWDVSSVTSMNLMFAGFNYYAVGLDAYFTNYPMAFNQDISGWNTGQVSSTQWMFATDADTRMRDLFEGSGYTVHVSNNAQSHAFSQSLGSWDVSNVTVMSDMLSGAPLSAAEYDSTLAGWSAQTLQDDVEFGAVGLKYCSGGTARANMVSTYSWVISDGGVNCLDLNPTSNLTDIDVATGVAPVNPDSTQRLIRLLKNDLPLAQANVMFDNAIDWRDVDGGTDSANYKSVISGLASADAVVGSHTLFVPRASTHGAVVICPHAQTLEQVSANCTNATVMTSADSNVSVVTIGGDSYWRVSGLTGTGGISVPSAPNTGWSPVPLPVFVIISGLGLVVMGVSIRRISRKRALV